MKLSACWASASKYEIPGVTHTVLPLSILNVPLTSTLGPDGVQCNFSFKGEKLTRALLCSLDSTMNPADFLPLRTWLRCNSTSYRYKSSSEVITAAFLCRLGINLTSVLQFVLKKAKWQSQGYFCLDKVFLNSTGGGGRRAGLRVTPVHLPWVTCTYTTQALP